MFDLSLENPKLFSLIKAAHLIINKPENSIFLKNSAWKMTN